MVPCGYKGGNWRLSERQGGTACVRTASKRSIAEMPLFRDESPAAAAAEILRMP